MCVLKLTKLELIRIELGKLKLEYFNQDPFSIDCGNCCLLDIRLQ